MLKASVEIRVHLKLVAKDTYSCNWRLYDARLTAISNGPLPRDSGTRLGTRAFATYTPHTRSEVVEDTESKSEPLARTYPPTAAVHAHSDEESVVRADIADTNNDLAQVGQKTAKRGGGAALLRRSGSGIGRGERVRCTVGLP